MGKSFLLRLFVRVLRDGLSPIIKQVVFHLDFSRLYPGWARSVVQHCNSNNSFQPSAIRKKVDVRRKAGVQHFFWNLPMCMVST